jgi:hypothetical protein
MSRKVSPWIMRPSDQMGRRLGQARGVRALRRDPLRLVGSPGRFDFKSRCGINGRVTTGPAPSRSNGAGAAATRDGDGVPMAGPSRLRLGYEPRFQRQRPTH